MEGSSFLGYKKKMLHIKWDGESTLHGYQHTLKYVMIEFVLEKQAVKEETG